MRPCNNCTGAAASSNTCTTPHPYRYQTPSATPSPEAGPTPHAPGPVRAAHAPDDAEGADDAHDGDGQVERAERREGEGDDDGVDHVVPGQACSSREADGSMLTRRQRGAKWRWRHGSSGRHPLLQKGAIQLAYLADPTGQSGGPMGWRGKGPVDPGGAGGAHDEEQLEGEEGGEDDVERVEGPAQVPRAALPLQLRVHLRLRHVDQEVLPGHRV